MAEPRMTDTALWDAATSAAASRQAGSGGHAYSGSQGGDGFDRAGERRHDVGQAGGAVDGGEGARHEGGAGVVQVSEGGAMYLVAETQQSQGGPGDPVGVDWTQGAVTKMCARLTDARAPGERVCFLGLCFGGVWMGLCLVPYARARVGSPSSLNSLVRAELLEPPSPCPSWP